MIFMGKSVVSGLQFFHLQLHGFAWAHGAMGVPPWRWVVYIGKSIVNMGKSIDWWFILKTLILGKPPNNISCDMKYGFGVTPVFRETYKSYKIRSDSTNTYENYE